MKNFLGPFLILLPTALLAAEDGAAFFEARVRPVLVEHCYECHNSSEKAKGKLALDYRGGLLKGGSEGPAIVPGKPEESLLLQSVRHDFDDLKMPKNGPKLDASVLADLAKWIAMGAPDPRDEPPSAEVLAETTSWEAIRERRKQWWSFRPVRKVEPPTPKNAAWSNHPVDRFILDRLEEEGLSPAEEAEPLVVLRRLSFALTGLPPTPAEQDAFVRAVAEDGMQAAAEARVDELLASPHFGERFARHWMDGTRYADSHGSEGDPAIPNAYRYRNYLIRALNADVPYDQLVREHLAGDLLPEPRVNEELGLNESAIGTASLRFVLHGFAPTDALDEHVRFTDDQIDAVTKTFLGLTVSCARCHDHKFDAISQKDYYALFGILSNGRPAQRVVDAPALLRKNEDALRATKTKLRKALAALWKKEADGLAEKLLKPTGPWTAAINDGHPHNPLRPWAKLRNLREERFAAEWKAQRAAHQAGQATLDKRHAGAYRRSWKLGDPEDYAAWSRSGPDLGPEPAPAGSFHVLPSGNRILDRILPSGAYTHLLSTKRNGALSSPRFLLDEGNVWIRAIGDKSGALRYVVWNYPRRGTVYPKGAPDPNGKWMSWNTKYWAGDQAHLEATTSRDHPVEAGGSVNSWLGVTEAVLAAPGQAPPRDEPAEALAPLFAGEDLAEPASPASPADLAARYAATFRGALDAWASDRMTDARARFLSHFVQRGLLPATLPAVPENVAVLVTEYRRLQDELTSPRLAPGLLDNAPFDQPLFTRGNHKQPTERVPRRFLEAIDATPYPKDAVGRLEYAEDILRPDNPLTSRVIANRLWQHLFGQGIARTPDNFGRLGEKPTHPELLDYLAAKIRADGWSLKKSIRFLASSKTFRLGSAPSARAKEKDPDNRLLSHAHLRRLEAEPIRDAILASARRLDLSRVAEGASEGNANTARRAVYRQTRRNALDPFLTVFDAPVPSTVKGRRDVTNVPAQSLTLMNDPFVLSAARDFAAKTEGATEAERISHMFRLALGRPATDEETLRASAYLSGATEEQTQALAEKQALEKRLAGTGSALDALLAPVRADVLQARKKPGAALPAGPVPDLHWNFSKGAADLVHGLKLHLEGGARVENGELVVSRGGYAVSDKLPFEVREKTLEVLVKLDDLGQRAGGALTLQTPNGSVFNSIVFAERTPGRWMSGSDRFSRTKGFGGPAETEADENFVHLAITYGADGTIAGYRNGRPHGKPYKTGVATFPKGSGVLSLGVRHLPANGSRMLHGRIREARLHRKALDAEAVLASYGAPTDYVSEKELLAALSPKQKARRAELLARRMELQGKLKDYADLPVNPTSNGLYDLALALYNMKEFIYLK